MPTRQVPGDAAATAAEEVDYDPNFQLYLQTKLANPLYIPEVQAQCTMVNFTVTEQGLEDQLLALVVKIERPDLEEQRADLIRAENDYKVQLSQLEDNLLYRLANSEGDILEDIELIENLEETKRTSAEIQEKVAEGKETGKVINKAREMYRPVAARGSLLYFLVDKLNCLEHMYQFSMANYVDILTKGINLTPANEKLEERVQEMVKISCFTVFDYVASGLFERHKLIFAAQLCFKIPVKSILSLSTFCCEGRKSLPTTPCRNGWQTSTGRWPARCRRSWRRRSAALPPTWKVPPSAGVSGRNTQSLRRSKCPVTGKSFGPSTSCWSFAVFGRTA